MILMNILTLQGLVEYAKQRHQEIGLYDAIAPVPEGIMTRSMFEKIEHNKARREIKRQKLGKKMLK